MRMRSPIAGCGQEKPDSMRNKKTLERLLRSGSCRPGRKASVASSAKTASLISGAGKELRDRVVARGCNGMRYKSGTQSGMHFAQDGEVGMIAEPRT